MLQVNKKFYNKIHKDYKGVWSNPSKPEWIGKRGVMSGCLDQPIGSLLIEGVHFQLVNLWMICNDCGKTVDIINEHEQCPKCVKEDIRINEKRG